VTATVLARVLLMAGAVTLFYRTTTPDELVASLQAHGLPPMATFVIHNAVAMVPRLAERAEEVTAAQRARGLDSEGSLRHRLRGVVAVAGPTVGGAISEAEARTLALESRGFTRPGRHTLLRVPADSVVQRAARWTMLAGVVALAMARLAGWTAP
jgi:energy-coupling factor transport system permease protein